VEQQFDEADVRAGLGVEEVAYLGTGNFGETWRAYFGGRDAACKIIHHEGSDNARLEREIIGYRRVSSKYVVELYDVATVHIAEKKRAMLVFEYIAGGNLRELLNVRRPDEDELRGLAHGFCVVYKLCMVLTYSIATSSRPTLRCAMDALMHRSFSISGWRNCSTSSRSPATRRLSGPRSTWRRSSSGANGLFARVTCGRWEQSCMRL
jgi:Protein kinase domain